MDSKVLHFDQDFSKLKRIALFKPYGFICKNGQNLKQGRLILPGKVEVLVYV